MALNSRLVFNEAYYRAQNPDVAAAIGVLQPDGVTLFTSGKDHFDRFGAAEGRVASPLFDATAYAANNPDLADAGLTTAAQLRTHFYTYGAEEGRNAMSSTVFNLDYYKANNQDLVDAGLSDAQIVRHFYEYGAAEGRLATVNFSVAAYKAANADLAGLSDAVARAHWYLWGAAEGRTFPQLAQSFTLTQSATQVAEGSGVTFTITSALPVTADTSFTYNVTGDTNGGTIDAAANSDFNGISGSVSIPAGSTSITFTITPTLDTTLEGLEGFKVTVFNSLLAVVGSKTAIITDNSANAPQTFTLTTSNDSPAGGSANDTIAGVVAANNGTGTTLNAGDVINGGGGTDTVNVSVSGSMTGSTTTSAVTFTGVERILVSNFDTSNDDNIIDLSLADSSLTTVGFSASAATGDTKFQGLNKIVAAEMTNGSADLELSYNSTPVSGTSDSQTLTLSGQTEGKFTVNGVETIAVTSSGSANTIQLVGAATTKVVVTGSANLTLTEGTSDVLATVDASGFTGKLSFTTNDTLNVSLTGGSGADTFELGTTFTSSDTIAGGGGNDTLSVSGTITDATFTKVTSVEVVKATAALTLTLDEKAQAAGVLSVTGSSGDDVVTVDAAGKFTNALTVALGAGNDKVVNSANVALTVTAGIANFDGNDTLTGGTGTDTLVLTAGTGTGKLTNVTLFEAVTVNAGTTATDDIAITVDADTVIAANKSLTVDASALTNSGATLTYDGSAISTGTKSQSVTGGAGNDTITGGSGNDTLIGGDGRDTITLGSGVDSVNGGAGNDTIVASALTSADTIDGGDGVDTLSVSGSIDASSLTNVKNVEALKLTGTGTVSLAAALSTITGIDLTDTGDQTVTLASGYTGSATVTLTGDATGNADKIVNSANATLNVVANVEDIDSSTTITGGTGVDTLTLKASTGAGDLTAVTGVDSIVIADAGDGATDGGKDVSLNFAVKYSTNINIDASALDENTSTVQETLTLTVESTSDAKFTVTGGAGNDTITTAAGNDSINGGAGNDSLNAKTGKDWVSGGAGDDTITFDSGAFDSDDTVVGGDGTDTLIVGNAVTDTGIFANVSSVENLKLSAAVNATLSTNTGGFTTVTHFDGGANTIQLDPGFTTAVTIDLTGATDEGDKFVNNSTAVTTITGNAVDFSDQTNDTTITGGNGVDTLRVKADATTPTTDATSVFFSTKITKVDAVVVVDGGDDATATGGSDNSGKDIRINLGTDYGTAISIDGSALDESNETLTVVYTTSVAADNKSVSVTGGAGNDSIQTGAAADSVVAGGGVDTVASGAGADYVDGGAGADSLDGGAGNDTVLGGAGADTIIGGTGGDVLTGGDGADIFAYTLTDGTSVSTQASTTAQDEITDFVSGTDRLSITYNLSALSASKNFNGVVVGNATSIADALSLLSSAGGESVFLTNSSTLVMDLNADGLIQSTDLQIKLTGATAFSADSINYTLTNSANTDLGTITTGGGNDSITDGTAANTIVAGAGNDTVTGGDGVDSLDGGAGDDIFIYATNSHFQSTSEMVDASVVGGSGTDTVRLDGTDALTIDSNDFESKISGVEKLVFNAAVTAAQSVTLSSTALDNSGIRTIDMSADTDAANGNTIDLSAATSGMSLVLTGSSGADTISGGAGADSITGGAGADVITSGGGADTLTGGDGDDTFKVATYTALTSVASVTGGDGTDVLQITTADTGIVDAGFSKVTSVATLTLTGASTAVLGTNANTAGITKVVTGNAATSITATVITALTVDATAQAAGTLTIGTGTSANVDITATNVAMDGVTATGSTGTLKVALTNDTSNAFALATGTGNVTVTGGDASDTVTVTGLATANQSFTASTASSLFNITDRKSVV